MSRLPKNRTSVEPPAFYSVRAAAHILGTSEMTLYRAIRDGEFPAVKVRGRVVIPAKALEALAVAAMDGQCLVEASHLVDSWNRDVDGDK